MSELIPATVVLDTSGTPFAPVFEDCYFSRQDGLAESRYVFLQGNGLPQRWQGQEQFTIAETGFGTGLNFLATWQAWRQDPRRCGRLHFISIEKHPIPKAQLQSLLSTWRELAEQANTLLENYPPLLSGFHRLRLERGQVTLTLCFMDVQAALAELVARVDAWYLDGFAPARNPQMWELPVLQGIARLSHANTSLATFTAASTVREGLREVGFAVEKRPGFGKKREMLVAKKADGAGAPSLPAWFALPLPSPYRTATVVGGGVAGCQVARSLAERGWEVTLLERHSRLATEASGNRAGVLVPKMTADGGMGEQFYRQAFVYAVQQLRRLETEGLDIEWKQCGALQLAHDTREAARQQAICGRGLPPDFVQILGAEQASAVAGLDLGLGASYFPQAGWLNPASLCAALVSHERITVRLLREATAPEPETLTVIANGREADQWQQTAFLPFQPVLGQTSCASASGISARLKTVLGHEGYITPAVARQHVFGATFTRQVREAVLDSVADATNFAQLSRYLPTLAAALSDVGSSHAAIRMTTPDRYPLVGAVPDAAFFQQAYAGLRHGNSRQVYPTAQYQSGVYIAAGFGSRGLTTSGLAGELLGALLTGEPLPVQASLYQALHPARFLVRQLKRG